MTMKVSKRKRPEREEKQFKERLKITDEVLDDFSTMVLVRFINAKLIKSVDYPVSSGKEAVVFRATAPDGTSVAIKVFKNETSAFKHMAKYIEGDPRFRHARHSKRMVVREWASKEFKNLRAAYEAGVPCPKPLRLKDNVIAMEFVGEKGVPYALLNDVVLQEPQKVFEQLMAAVKKLYLIKLVHADLSPYNIIIKTSGQGNEQPVIIDWGQAVLLEHPRAQEFLEHDVRTLCDYFRKLGVECDAGNELEKIVG